MGGKTKTKKKGKSKNKEFLLMPRTKEAGKYHPETAKHVAYLKLNSGGDVYHCTTGSGFTMAVNGIKLKTFDYEFFDVVAKVFVKRTDK